MQGSSNTDRTIALILVGVLAVMLWPIWLAVVAAERSFTWTVALSALIPLGVTVAVIAAAMRLPTRVAHGHHPKCTHWASGYTEETHRHA